MRREILLGRIGAALLSLCLLLQPVSPVLAQVVSAPVTVPVAPVSVGGLAPVSRPKPTLTLSPGAALAAPTVAVSALPAVAVPAAASARAAAASAVAAPKAVAGPSAPAQGRAETPLASLKEAAPAVAKAPAPALRALFDGGRQVSGRSGVVDGRSGGLSRTGLARSAWWRDPAAAHAGVTVPLYSLRREKGDPGVGKFTDFAAYYRDVLAKQGAKVVHLLPHFAVRGESPYAPVSLFAVNEDHLDWAVVPEVKADPALAAKLEAKTLSQKQAVDYEALRAREAEVARAAYRAFDRTSQRGRAFEDFKAESAAWLGEYAEFMALSKAVGKPVLQWTPADLAGARGRADFSETVETHEFAQWLAYGQLQEALATVHDVGGRVLFDIPMFRGKDSVDAWKRPEVFTDLRTRNPGIKNQWINEDWKDLGLWNWGRAKSEGYAAMLAPYRHWLDLGFDGARVDALHFAYDFGNGQMVSGDEPGDDYVKALAQVFSERGAFPLAEAFEGKAEAAERFGFVTVYGDWKKVSSHDDPRSDGFIGRFLAESRKPGSGRNARFTGYTLGDEWGDPFPVKEMAGGTSHWRWRIPLPSDPDYGSRARWDVRAQLGAWMAVLAGKVWSAGAALKGAFLKAGDSFVKHAGGGVQIWAASLDWFLEEWGRDTFISLPGLLLSTGRRGEARENIRGFARHEADGLIPNRLPGGGAAAEYNTVDGSMWFVQAVKKAGDPAFAAEMLPVLRKVMRAYAEGTGYQRYGRYNRIYMDSDGLIVSPAQSTWMDADPEGRDRPVTPRHGKAVEINALWYANLRYLAELEREAGDAAAASEADARAERVKQSFNKKFWFANEENRRAWGGTGGALRDVVEGDPHGEAVRPNMLVAVSHGLDLLSPERQAAVVLAATRDLLTPYGMRTLSYRDPRYQGRYDTAKPPLEKDQAYHQGTVWPWLMGPYLDALVKVRRAQGWSSERISAELRGVLTPLAEFLAASTEGSLPEVFDGGSSEALFREFSLEDRAGLGPAMARAARAQNRGGTRSQAWSVAEVLRVMTDYGLFGR
ncbi:MAG: 4-alpha-glucanotransferase [Elusimicrobia bacterium]|nr:4-alpha-glucanotransferase [Elusimicrobiota bacterium]